MTCPWPWFGARLIPPMRHFFKLHPYIQEKHLDAMGKLILVTSLVLTYFYISEIFTAWYSGDHFEKASLFWRVTESYAWALWLQYSCNSVAPLALFWRRARTSPLVLYVVSILVLIGMWFAVVIVDIRLDTERPGSWRTSFQWCM